MKIRNGQVREQSVSMSMQMWKSTSAAQASWKEYQQMVKKVKENDDVKEVEEEKEADNR